MERHDPFHDGERRVQKLAGESDRADRTGQVIGDAIPAGAIPFLSERPMLVAATTNPSGDVSVSALFGDPGLSTAPDPRTIVIDRTLVREDPDDPIWRDLRQDPRIGLLSIDLGTRRRLRVNGRVTDIDDSEVRITVDEAYPNCPRFIQQRHLDVEADRSSPGLPRGGSRLDAMLRSRIVAADTLFVASMNPRGQLDASHRGGAPGFVQVLDGATLRVPDYPGNSMFNTLGNFALHPRACLLLPAFEDAYALRVHGDVELRFDLDDPEGLTGGTGRGFDLQVDRWSLHPAPARLCWRFGGPSQFNLPTARPRRRN